MTFDPNLYAQLAAVNPAAAAQYIAGFQAPAAAPAPVAAAVQPQPQAQPQGYANPAAVQPPAQQLARGTLEDFYNQPSAAGGGPSVTSKFFTKRAQGAWLQMQVAADVTNSDVRQQTTPQGIPQTFRDGRPKFVLVVKVKVLNSSDGSVPADFPEGEGSIWIKGLLADELKRAMAAAGDPSGYPKGGAVIVMQSAGEQPSRTPGFSATKLYTIQYAAPAGGTVADPTPPAAAPQAATIPAAPVTAAAPAPILTPIPSATAPVPGAAPVTPAVPATAAAAPTLPPVPAEAPAAKDVLLAQLSGQA